MIEYDVYLEGEPAGPCMAHVLALPGCFVRAESQIEAMHALPAEVRAYQAWLGAHGELFAVPVGAPVHLRFAEVRTSGAPLVRRGRAELFGPERRPMDRAELCRLLEWSAWCRHDLLALLGAAPAAAWDWRAEPHSLSLAQIVEHVGAAELRYVSSLVPPECRHARWPDRLSMPLLAWLAAERLAVSTCLAQLEPALLSRVACVPGAPGQPDELWSARKVMRRLLEHEREHIEQVRATLALFSLAH
jgi:hypothetical protein